MTFTVGQKVEITRFWSRTETLAQLEVTKVSSLKVVLSDGSEWRASDGYEWGKKTDKHFGRQGQRRIQIPKETVG
jgi:hypothetical protein